MDNSARALKEQGNKAFSAGNFKEAEVYYTRAIQRDSANPLLYTNRAFARIKLSSWDACIDDCLRAIELNSSFSSSSSTSHPAEMKAFYYLAQAQLALKHPNEGLVSALRAYELCLATRSTSTSAVCALALRAKKEKWEAKERQRVRQRSELLTELEASITKSGRSLVEELLDRVERGDLAADEVEREIEEAENQKKGKVEELMTIFAIADPANLARREVPDYMIDSITFAIMFDPVITKHGHSYERSTIEQHLLANPTDPLTREPLRIEDLRPNLALKAACAEFLENNGWAVDW